MIKHLCSLEKEVVPAQTPEVLQMRQV